MFIAIVLLVESLVLFKQRFIFVLEILGLLEPIFGQAEFFLQRVELVLQPVDLSLIVVNVIFSGGFIVEITLTVRGYMFSLSSLLEALVPRSIEFDAICPGSLPSLSPAIRVSLRHLFVKYLSIPTAIFA